MPVTPDAITLGDFKRCINKPNYKFFFQSFDEDFGQVKEEITHDAQTLPKTQEGKIVCFLTPSDVKQVISPIWYTKFELKVATNHLILTRGCFKKQCFYLHSFS